MRAGSTLSIRHLTPADYRVMPWKNGQGTTTEIAAMPEGAGLDTFTWRVSIADIGAPGPFSIFPGVERIIVQTEGEPMSLVHEGLGGDGLGRERHGLGLLRPYRFSGDRATSGEVSGPVRDFNAMARRAQVRPSLTVHELAPGSRARVLAPGSAHLVHALRGALTVTAGATDQVWSLAQGDTWLLMNGRDDVDADTSFEIIASAGDAVAITLTFG